MSNVINVTNAINLVGVIARVCLVVKRNVATLPESLRRLHLEMRRHDAWAGYPAFLFGALQPARATAMNAAAATSRRVRGGCPASRPSTRLG